jgi:hypothetical protein
MALQHARIEWNGEMRDVSPIGADPEAISQLRGDLQNSSDLTEHETAVVARFLNASSLPVNKVAGGSVWQPPSFGDLSRLPGVVCAEVVAANILVAAWIETVCAPNPGADYGVLALLDLALLLCSLGVLGALARRGASRARRTAVGTMAAFILAIAYLFALANYAALNNAEGVGYVMTLGIPFLAIPLAAAAFSITRAFLPPRDTQLLIGPEQVDTLEAGPARLHQG